LSYRGLGYCYYDEGSAGLGGSYASNAQNEWCLVQKVHKPRDFTASLSAFAVTY